jgi:hypothetical protein
MRRNVWAVAFLVSMSGCGARAVEETANAVLVPVDEPGGGGGNTGGSSSVCKTVTVSGSAFYNDQRRYGLFQTRSKKNGGAGQQYRMINGTGTSEPHTLNYLGLYEATVEIYENDLIYQGHPGCAQTSLVATTTVNSNGHWSWTGNVCDTCGNDDLTESDSDGEVGVTVSAKTVLRYCPDSTGRCFSVRNPGAWDEDVEWDDHGASAVTYGRWASDANQISGQQVFTNGRHIPLASMNFEGSANNVADLDAQAANVFASLVDTTRVVHETHGITFKRTDYGELKAIFPANFPGVNGHSHEPGDKICMGAWGSVGMVEQPCGLGRKPGLPEPIDCPPPVEQQPFDLIPREWHDGTTPMHEYGHIINYRAWEGHGKWTDYGYMYSQNGYDRYGETDEVEHYSAAFKEQWATFIERVTLDSLRLNTDTKSTLACSDASWDNDDSSAVAINDGDPSTNTAILCQPGAPCAYAGRSPNVVLHTLCDWFDNSPDSLTNATFNYADTFGSKDLHSMWQMMRDMWTEGEQSAKNEYTPSNLSDMSTWAKAGLGICDMAKRQGWSPWFDNMLRHNGLACELITWTSSASSTDISWH